MVHIDQNDKFDKLFESTMGLGNAINNFSNNVKSGIDNFLKVFKPTYSVNAVIYFVIPGAPLKTRVRDPELLRQLMVLNLGSRFVS